VKQKSVGFISRYIVRVSESVPPFGNRGIDTVGSQAFQLMNDPASTPEQLRYVLTVAPELAPGVAMHPHLDEALRRWLWDSSDLQIRQIIYDRFAREVEMAQAKGQLLTPETIEYCQTVINAVEFTSAMREETPVLPDLHTEMAPSTVVVPQGPRPSVGFGSLLLPTGETIELTCDRVLVGRAPFVEDALPVQLVAIDDPDRFVSANHVLLECRDEIWYVTDMGSTNGTVVISLDEEPIVPGIPVPVQGALNLGGYIVALSGRAASLPPEDSDEGEDTQYYSLDMTSTVFPEGMVLKSDMGEATLLYTTPVLIGRRPDSSMIPAAQVVAVNDRGRTMSKTHARLDYFEGKWFITDLGAANGVAVHSGGYLVEADPGVPFAIGDAFSLGDREFVLEKED